MKIEIMGFKKAKPEKLENQWSERERAHILKRKNIRYPKKHLLFRLSNANRSTYDIDKHTVQHNNVQWMNARERKSERSSDNIFAIENNEW